MRAEYREEPCRAALNRVRGMPFSWSLNPYMGCQHRCTFCYVRFFEQRAERAAGEQYGRSVRVKVNVVEVLRRELARPSWRRETVAVGAATDPYQPAEARYRLTRGCLEALGRSRTPFGIVTRAPLVTRDLDVLAEASRRAEVSVSFSVPTLNESVWRTTEPGTPHPRQRLRALRTLIDGGVKAGVALAPLLPGIGDDERGIAEVVRAARAAGATFLWANVLHLRPGTREHFLESIRRAWPEKLPLYESLYDGRAYLPRAETQPALDRVKRWRERLAVADRRRIRIEPEPEPRQLDLAI